MARNTSGSHTSATDARARARQIQEEQRRKDRRRRTGVIWGSVLAVVLVIGLVVAFVLNRNGDDAAAAGPIPAVTDEQGGVELTSATDLAEGAGEREVDPSRIEVPKQSASSQPETLPNTEARADGEPTRIVLYADFNCVHCADFESSNADQIEQWLEQGEATVEYRMVDFLSAPNNQNFSARAANAAYCVAEQAPEHYNAFVTDVFGAYEGHGGKGLSDDELAQRAEALGADVSDCMEQDTYRPAVAYTTQKAKAAPIQGTPTVYVDGQWWTREQAFQEWASPIVEG